jgi:histidyl-tRNA synthetase
MSTILPKTLKGFRDFLPLDAKKRQYVINTVQKVFSSYGFEPLETPTLEYEEILTGKYGNEGDTLMYRFEDNGKRKVAMRYDQTVPLARVIAQYQNQLTFPFKRYQIQPVWRAENTQKGRYREFIQCDIDTIGTDAPLADAEIIATVLSLYKKLGFTNLAILLNDRKVFDGFPMEAIITLDKLKKIGEDGVCHELVTKNVTKSFEEAKNLVKSLLDQKPTERITQIMNMLEQFGIDLSVIQYSPTLARGLNYYTDMIFEIETPDYPYGSLCGGGRYDELIGMFMDKKIPAVGSAIGFDRTLEAMEALQLFPADLSLASAQVLVTVFSPELEKNSIDLCSLLRCKNIPAEMYLDNTVKLEKQLKYADQKNIPYVMILGPQEIEKNRIIVKNMKTREQKEMTRDEGIKFFLKDVSKEYPVVISTDR